MTIHTGTVAVTDIQTKKNWNRELPWSLDIQATKEQSKHLYKVFVAFVWTYIYIKINPTN